jgi:hypothetical protein
VNFILLARFGVIGWLFIRFPIVNRNMIEGQRNRLVVCFRDAAGNEYSVSYPTLGPAHFSLP